MDSVSLLLGIGSACWLGAAIGYLYARSRHGQRGIDCAQARPPGAGEGGHRAGGLVDQAAPSGPS